MSTIERAFALARTGRYATLTQLHRQLEADGCRAVASLLSTRSIKGHLEAICAATSAATNKAMPAETSEAMPADS